MPFQTEAGGVFFTEFYRTLYNGGMLPSRRYAEWLPGMRKRPVSWIIPLGIAFSTAISVFSPSFVSSPASLRPFYAAGSVFLFALAFIESRSQRNRLPPTDIPTVAESFPVILTLSRGVEYGIEEGHVTFVEGWLLYSGPECEFSVRQDDVEVQDSWKFRFDFQGPQVAHRVELSPLGRGFQEAWTYWFWKRASPDGEPTFPPIAVSPSHRPMPLGLIQAAALLILSIPNYGLSRPLAYACWGMAVWSCLRYLADRDALRRIAEGKPPRFGQTSRRTLPPSTS